MSSGSSSSHPGDVAGEAASAQTGAGEASTGTVAKDGAGLAGQETGGGVEGEVESGRGDGNGEETQNTSNDAATTATTTATTSAKTTTSNINTSEEDERELTRHDSNISNDVFYTEDDTRGKDLLGRQDTLTKRIKEVRNFFRWGGSKID